MHATCPHCGSDDVEHIGSDMMESEEYFCGTCQNAFVVNWDKVEDEENNNDEEYYESGEYEEEE